VNKIEEKYEQVAVKINSNGINGSGCIVQPNNSDYSYIFTAKHCLTENDIIDTAKIKISSTKFTNAKQITIREILLNKELDIAVIQIDKLTEIEISKFINPKKDLPIQLFGFPHLLKGESQILSGKISFSKENHSDIEFSHSQITFDKSTPDTIKGFSGSGIFYEETEKVSIVGILTELKAQDGAYNSVRAVHIRVFDKLITSNGLPSLFEDYFGEIITDYSFSFTNYNCELEKHYLVRNIDDFFNSAIQSPKNIWINGEPGVGKTLLINRNLKRYQQIFIPIDLTTSPKDNIDEYFQIINTEIINQKDIEKPIENGNIYDRIALNLEKITNTELLIITVDEVPIKSNEIFTDFLSGFIKISEKFSNTTKGHNQIKWIVSTRINPESYIKGLNDCLIDTQKAVKHFIFKKLELWSNDELNSLIDLLEKNLNFCVSSNTKQKMIEISNGIPNTIKRVIELILIDKCNIETAIETVKAEYI